MVPLHRVHQVHQHSIRNRAPNVLLRVMNSSVVVLDQLVDEALVLVQHLLPHVGDVVENCLVLHEEVLLCGAPHVVAWESLDGREGGEGDLCKGGKGGVKGQRRGYCSRCGTLSWCDFPLEFVKAMVTFLSNSTPAQDSGGSGRTGGGARVT